MKKETIGMLSILSLMLSLCLVTAGPVEATDITNFQYGGDRLVSLQNNDGGWDWPLDDGNPASTSPLNTIGPIGMGLAQTYLITGDPDHLDALNDAAGLLLSKTNYFSPPDGYLAVILDDILGGTACTNHAMTNYYGKLAAGTFDYKGLGTLYDTAGYVQLIRDTRASQGIPNLAAWDIGMGLVAAATIGADTTAWIAGVKAEINELDGDGQHDVIGLAGAVYGLAFVGEDFDPTTGEHAAANNLEDLADILVGYQLVTGGFTQNSNDLNEGVQETAYAILALQEMGGYGVEVNEAEQYITSAQLGTGGWENSTTEPGENNEYTGEALWALKIAGGIQTATGTGIATLVPDSGSIENRTAIPESAMVPNGKPYLLFPHGFFGFEITGLAPGETVTVTIVLPSAAPMGTQYWKYGPTPGDQTDHWYQLPPVGDDDGDNVITITLVDGGLGDDDLTANGTIIDDGGPGNPVPTDDSEGGCFIATAAYGTPMAEEIDVLRDFRDQYLLTNPVGEELVELYYNTSPPIADFIAEHPALKQVVRAGLEPIITVSSVVVNTTMAMKIAILSSMTLLSVSIVVWLRKRAVRSPAF